MTDPQLVELRAANDQEVPWKGPINEYSVADAVAGEMACRLAEGDVAGARVLVEMLIKGVRDYLGGKVLNEKSIDWLATEVLGLSAQGPLVQTKKGGK